MSWVYAFIEVRGKKPVCLKRKECAFFTIDFGVLNWRAKVEKVVFGCVLGQFRLTRNIKDIPNHCSAKILNKKIGPKYEEVHT